MSSDRTKFQSTLFEQALGEDFHALAREVRDLHQVLDRRRWSGVAKVTRGKAFPVPFICRLFGFPPAADQLPVKVTITRNGDAEIWQRDFGGHLMSSVLRPGGKPGSGLVTERFGFAEFDIRLTEDRGMLRYPLRRGRLFGVPVPKALLPVSDTVEKLEDGRFCFDIRIALPLVGPVIHYQGWLREEGLAVGEAHSDNLLPEKSKA